MHRLHGFTLAHSLFLVAKSFSACRSLEPSLTNSPLWSRDSRYRGGTVLSLGCTWLANAYEQRIHKIRSWSPMCYKARKDSLTIRKLDDEHEPSRNSWGAHPDVVLGYHIFACSRSANIIKLFRVRQPFAVPTLTSRQAVCLSHCKRIATCVWCITSIIHQTAICTETRSNQTSSSLSSAIWIYIASVWHVQLHLSIP